MSVFIIRLRVQVSTWFRLTNPSAAAARRRCDNSHGRDHEMRTLLSKALVAMFTVALMLVGSETVALAGVVLTGAD
jgi:hypothetical protein